MGVEQVHVAGNARGWGKVHRPLGSLVRRAAPRATISATRRGASAIMRGISAVSGRLRQYFRGISARIAPGFSRAGLKMAA
jgi:hypothetical protein